jgi:hypothetical protein
LDHLSERVALRRANSTRRVLGRGLDDGGLDYRGVEYGWDLRWRLCSRRGEQIGIETILRYQESRLIEPVALFDSDPLCRQVLFRTGLFNEILIPYLTDISIVDLYLRIGGSTTNV